MVHVKIRTREVVEEDFPQTTLDVLAKDMSYVYLDNSIMGRDYNRSVDSYLDHLRQDDGFPAIHRHRVEQQRNHTNKFGDSLFNNGNIIISPEVLSEYEVYISFLDTANQYFDVRSSFMRNERHEIIELHKFIYDLLEKRPAPYENHEVINFPKFLRESTLHKPRDGKFKKWMSPVSSRPSGADSELVGHALGSSYWAAVNKTPTKMAIITGDYDMVNLVRNFGTTIEGSICSGLGTHVEVYFPSGNWQNTLGLEFQCDSTGFDKYDDEKTEIVVET